MAMHLVLTLDHLNFCPVFLEQYLVPRHASIQRGLDPRFCPFACGFHAIRTLSPR